MRTFMTALALAASLTACKWELGGSRRQQTAYQGADQDKTASAPTKEKTTQSGDTDGKAPVVKPEPTEAACIDADASVCAIEKRILELTNELRAENGSRAPLALSPKISFVARDWSQQMSQRITISHAGFPSKRQQVYQEKFHEAASFSAENVAMGYTGINDTEGVARYFYDMWRKSPGHRLNMLSNHRFLGVGVFKAGNSWYATQIFQ